MSAKISMKTPLVELDGDEMAHLLWTMVKEQLIVPFVDLKTEYYDLSLLSRNNTDDEVTAAGARAAQQYGVAVKCSTITVNAARMREYPWVKQMWKSPNATIRGMLDGTVFRTPILVPQIKPAVSAWEKPITLARHAFGGVQAESNLQTDEPGTCKLVFTGQSGRVTEKTVRAVDGPAVWQGDFNLDSSIRSFADACFTYAIDTRQDLWFSCKDTISKVYDGHYRDIFRQVYEQKYRASFEQLGITYVYCLIDNAVARVMRCRGGFIWACKNYDGDVMSDMLSSAFGSSALMTSVLVSPDGRYEFETAHGTVARHYRRYLEGEAASSNPVATVFAWSGALKKRGELDELPTLVNFGRVLEEATLQTIASGTVTGDLASLMPGCKCHVQDSEHFLEAIADRVRDKLQNQ